MYQNWRDSDQPATLGELRLRHLTVAEALPRLEQYLDAAFRAGLSQVKIIHGKGGTGIIRRLVRDVLSKHPLVRSYRWGDHREGGVGVTIVEFTEK